MPVVAVILVPLLVCALLAGATYEQWRRMGRADYAASWLWAFVVLGAGWLAAGVEALLAPNVAFPGSALVLCWFAAPLLIARGLRQRVHKRDRGIVLLGIWVGTTIGVTMLQDLALADPVLRSAIGLVVIAWGAGLAAVASGPRHRRAAWSAWLAGVANAVFSAVCLLLAFVVLSVPAIAIVEFTAMVMVPLIVLCGVMVMVCLNEDRAQALERLARTDALTGVWNRRGFEEGARHMLDRFYATGGRTAAVAIADIDGFKGINDGHGHAVGDATLARFAETLRAATEPGDMLARLGGEEFAILAIGVDGPALQQRVDRVRSLLNVPNIDPHGPPAITASFGVAKLDPEHRSLRDALERADRALYKAKNDGRNRVTLAD